MKTPNTEIRDRIRRMNNAPDRKLMGANIAEHLERVSDGEKATHYYFRSKSKLFEHIRGHIISAKDCAILDREGREVSCHRGSGYAVDFEKAYTPFSQPPDVPKIVIYFKVGFSPLEDDPGYNGYDGGGDIVKKYHVAPPLDLELNFTQEKFNAWIEQMREKRDAEKSAEDVECLKKLVSQYPQIATVLVKKHKSWQNLCA